MLLASAAPLVRARITPDWSVKNPRWPVVPTALGRYLGDSDRTKANRVMQAMMGMRKIVIAELDKAYAG